MNASRLYDWFILLVIIVQYSGWRIECIYGTSNYCASLLANTIYKTSAQW